MKTVFSGIQPTGKVHLGNFLGAIKNWVHLSNEENKNFFCVVDLHSITTHPDPKELKSNIEQTLKLLIAAGINLDNSIIYAQSSVPQHAYLSWILSSFCQVGELQRMTQYKEKADSLGSHAGIFTYPVLMASDILIHKANEVPVGDDQTQHLELTRNIAERFNLPVITFIDTPGAYPGIGAEERGQSEAIARSTDRTLSLGVPVISIIIGEGGSGGAIAIAAANKVLMLEHSIYTVASPEASASILWRSSDEAKVSAIASEMKITSKDLKKLGVIDQIIDEPIGGAHRERSQIIMQTKLAILDNLDNLSKLNPKELIQQRRDKFLKIGRNI